jgi:hypothetical protein
VRFAWEKATARQYDRDVRACSLLALAALSVLLPCGAAVAAPRAELSVERASGAEDCPDTAALEAMLARIVSPPGTTGEGGGDDAVEASVAFGRSAVGYAAELRVRGGKDGERTLTDTGPTCTALGRAVSITLALILDAHAELAPPPAAPVVASPPPAPAARPTSAGVLAATLGPAFGLVGRPTLAGGLELDVRLGRRLLVEAGGQLAAPRSTTFDTGSVEVGLAVALVGICGVLADPDASLVVAACARGVAGQLRGEGAGFASSNGATLGWWGAGGGLEVRGAVGRRWLLGATADVLAPLRRDTFSVGNRGVAYGSDAVAAMLRLGVGWRVW